MSVRATLGWASTGMFLTAMVGLAAWGTPACGSSRNGFTPTEEAGAPRGDDASLGDLLDGEAANSLSIAPQNAVLDVTAPGMPLQLQAFLNGSKTPSPALWSVDVAALGTIDGGGLFKASGTLGGITRITATVGNAKAQTNLTVRLHLVDNPGKIDPGTQTKLKAGGSGDPTFKWLYPYDQTVFPRGLRAPTLQLAGTPAKATYVHITASSLDYQGFYGPSTPIRIDFADPLWKTISLTAGAKDPVKIEISKITDAGDVTGPAAQTIYIAQGSLKGTVYYNTYNSPQAGGHGAVMRVKPNAASAEVLIGSPSQSEGCTVCHAVSANGSVLVASHENYQSGASWDLTKPPTSDGGTPVMHEQPDSTFSFGALYPDGAFLMSNAALTGSWPPNVPGQEQGPRPSRLYDTKTGAMIAAPGWDNVIQMAITPTFSQNGKRLGFNHYDKDQGHTLSVMDFDVKTKTFSNLVDLYTDATTYPAWPAFTPDGDWVVFHTDSSKDYATWNGAKADLSIAHIPSKTIVKLDALNGYKGGVPYLPYGEAEAHLNYEPTILPVAVGGYYWAVFTSRRKYGNTITDDAMAPTAPEDAQDRKKLWIAALDIEGTENPHTSAYDKSHPAFYLSAQELEAGNMRGFWALDPCKQDGNTCETGDECCGGFCRQQTKADGGSALVCVPPPSGCANEFEKCTTTADCCGAAQGYQCLNGHCAKPAPN